MPLRVIRLEIAWVRGDRGGPTTSMLCMGTGTVRDHS